MNKNLQFSVGKADVETIFNMIRSCEYIAHNPDYNEKIKATKVFFEGENDQVNAYATVRDEVALDSYKIVIFNGICNALKLGSFAIARFYFDKNIESFTKAINWIGNTTAQTGEFTARNVGQGMSELDIDATDTLTKEAKSYLSGALLALLGHEAGHIVLSHVVRPDTGNANSRNDERMADLVACAIADSTPFAMYSIFGGLIMEMVFAWIHKDAGEETESTHPYSRERVYNWVNSHREYLENFGINKKNIESFLPVKK